MAARSERPLNAEYLTTEETADLLRVKPKTLRNKIAAGVFRKGEHFFRKPGLGPRWKREAIVRWLEGGETEEVEIFAFAQPGGRRVA